MTDMNKSKHAYFSAVSTWTEAQGIKHAMGEESSRENSVPYTCINNITSSFTVNKELLSDHMVKRRTENYIAMGYNDCKLECKKFYEVRQTNSFLHAKWKKDV